ncbi:MAG: serine hydrolase [Candidatus Sumerlaeaceae bacterium]|nr:serine hydrolase [Candidatus Sumerlaeaceae bacterium]
MRRLIAWRLGAALVVMALARAMSAEPQTLTITDDPALDRAMAEARAEFMAGKPFDRLDAVILVAQPDGSWKRGSHNPEALAYPASCVKFPFMVAAMHWCKTNGFPPDHLDHCVGPMVRVSDNVQTGVVVDIVTSTTNIADLTTSADPRYAAWYEARLYFEKYFSERGLLAGQTLVHKTYPTNSGEWPAGAEKVAREHRGMNMMKPSASAELMVRVAKGLLEPQAREYMMGLLQHNPWKASSVAGFGLPPGSRYFNKTGLAYDTLEDIAYIVLPNGREVVLAMFSNAFRPPYSRDPSPYDGSQLGGFAELLLEKAGLLEGCPPKVIVDNSDPGFRTTGDWEKSTSGTDKLGADFMRKQRGRALATAAWELSVPEAGYYEVCVRQPQSDEYASDAPWRVIHADGESTFSLDQQKVGGRWRLLGTFRFEKGTGRVEVSDRVTSATQYVVADAVKATRWPDKVVEVPGLAVPALPRPWEPAPDTKEVE